jgi:hypothetical protein
LVLTEWVWKNVKHDRIGKASVVSKDDLKAKAVGALRRLQKMPAQEDPVPAASDRRLPGRDRPDNRTLVSTRATSSAWVNGTCQGGAASWLVIQLSGLRLSRLMTLPGREIRSGA